MSRKLLCFIHLKANHFRDCRSHTLRRYFLTQDSLSDDSCFRCLSSEQLNNPPAAHPRGIRAPQGSPNVVLGAMHAILAPLKVGRVVHQVVVTQSDTFSELEDSKHKAL